MSNRADEQEPAPPRPWAAAEEQARAWWAGLGGARSSLLICDYDGTLAPFRDNKMEAVPYKGVTERLKALAAMPGVTLALVSGRPVAELITLLPLAARLELYGSHGREHRGPDGSYELAEITDQVRAALDEAENQLGEAGWRAELERKAGSLALHWRGLAPERAARAQEAAEAVFARHSGGTHVSVLHFDGGLELRATDSTKAHAVEALLASYPDRPTAYLGDDTTDEDAFRALGSRGLSLLVRCEPRPSAAPFYLRPPEELLSFLDQWAAAAKGGEEHYT